MAIKNTSILLLFLGVAALFLAAEVKALTPIIGPGHRPTPPPPDSTVCDGLVYPEECEKSTKQWNDRFKAAIRIINKSIRRARQGKDIAHKIRNSTNQHLVDECIQHLNAGIFELVAGVKAFKAKTFIDSRSHMERADDMIFVCYELGMPKPLENICYNYSDWTVDNIFNTIDYKVVI